MRAEARSGADPGAHGTVLVIDPFLSPRADRLVPPRVDPASIHGVDAILATHEHRDHLDPAA